jgi:hypothetical protein
VQPWLRNDLSTPTMPLVFFKHSHPRSRVILDLHAKRRWYMQLTGRANPACSPPVALVLE